MAVTLKLIPTCIGTRKNYFEKLVIQLFGPNFIPGQISLLQMTFMFETDNIFFISTVKEYR